MAKGLHKQSIGAGKKLRLAGTPKKAQLVLFCLAILRIPISYIAVAFSEVGTKLNFAAYRLRSEAVTLLLQEIAEKKIKK